MPDIPSVPSGESIPPEEKREDLERSEQGEREEGTSEGAEGILEELTGAVKKEKKATKGFGDGILGEIVKRGEKLLGRDESSVLEEEVRSKLDGVDEEAEEAASDFISKAENIAGVKGEKKASAQVTEEETEASSEEPNEVEGEVVFHNGEWLDEDISEETKKWLNGEGHEEFSGGFTEEEKNRAENFKRSVYENTTGEEMGKHRMEGDPGIEEILEELFDKEGDIKEETGEALKLLLRIAIKAGTKLAVSIAKNISKDRDVDPEVRIMMGVFADGIEDAGKFLDSYIAGDAEANLKKDIIAFVKDKRN